MVRVSGGGGGSCSWQSVFAAVAWLVMVLVDAAVAWLVMGVMRGRKAMAIVAVAALVAASPR